MMPNTPIVNDYIPIAEALARLEQDRRMAQFVLPEGVNVLIRSEVSARTGMPDRCPLCFLLDESIHTMTLITQCSRERLTTHVGQQFIEHMQKFFPTMRIAHERELRFSPADLANLVSRIRKSR